MNWHDLVTLAVILITGFWTIHKELTAIRVAINDSVTHDDCSKKRDKCPLIKRIELLEGEKK